MHTIRVYSRRTRQLVATFTGPSAEKQMRDAFAGEPDAKEYNILR